MKSLILALTLALSTTVQAIEWDSLEVSHQTISTDGIDDFSGLGFAGTKLIGDYLIVEVAHESVESSAKIRNYKIKMEIEATRIGLGSRTAISKDTDFFAILSYVEGSAKISTAGYSQEASAKGTSLDIGLRSMVSSNVELAGFVSLNKDSSNKTINIGTHYYFSDSFSMGVNYEKDSDVKGVSLIAKVYF